MVGDIHISEPGATIGFAGRRVIEETVRETLPPDFQTAEYLLEHGMVDMVVPRGELNEKIGSLLDLMMNPSKPYEPKGKNGKENGKKTNGNGGKKGSKSKSGGAVAIKTADSVKKKPANSQNAQNKAKQAAKSATKK